MESRPIPRLTPEEDAVFQQSYARWLAFAEALLAGEDSGEAVQGVTDGQTALLDDDEDDDAPSSGTIKDRILDLLADGQPWAIRDIRRALDGVSPASVNNAVGELHQAERLIALRRGTYQINPN
ncbi:hypothetical protein [Streptomyces sp. Ac-502]|uniref:hypothetical protein n=1 Tax=Streptomyces sp. Ac-502 TaxID=3342801 RepID=UPI0038624F90